MSIQATSGNHQANAQLLQDLLQQIEKHGPAQSLRFEIGKEQELEARQQIASLYSLAGAESLPPPEIVTVEEAEATSVTLTFEDSAQAVFDITQLFKLLADWANNSFKLNVEKRQLQATMSQQLGEAAAKAKEEAAASRFTAAMTSAAFQMTASAVQGGGAAYSAGKGIAMLNAADPAANEAQLRLASDQARLTSQQIDGKAQLGSGGLNAIGSFASAGSTKQEGEKEAEAAKLNAMSSAMDKAYGTASDNVQQAMKVIGDVAQFMKEIPQAETQTIQDMARNV